MLSSFIGKESSYGEKWGLFLPSLTPSNFQGFGSGWRRANIGVGGMCGIRGISIYQPWSIDLVFFTISMISSSQIGSYRQQKEIGARVISASLVSALTLFMPLIFYLTSNCCLTPCFMKRPGIEIRFGSWICISDSC